MNKVSEKHIQYPAAIPMDWLISRILEFESHLEAVRSMSAPPRGEREGMLDTPSPPSVLMN